MRIILFSRKRLFISLFIGIVLLFATMINQKILPAFNLFAERPTVVLDAGHGGRDEGTARGDIKEKEVNLDIVLRLADYLGNRGVAVGLTRETDVDLGGALKKGRHRKDLQARVEKLNQAMVGVSVHVNSGGSGNEGAIIFYSKDNEEGKQLAEFVLSEVGKVQVLDHDFVVPRSNLYILKNTNIPTILIEVGFITNANDRSRLTNPDWRQQMAEAIGAGILRYLASGSF